MPAVEKQWPEIIAMILADVVHRDGATGKFSILGIHSVIVAPGFPWTHPHMTVYLALTDGRGETPMKMRLIDADDGDEPIFESETLLNFTDPTDVIELQFVQADVIFPKPGEYRLQLFGAGEFLRERRVLVAPLQQPGQSGETNPDEN
jgi:hypothetical protein